MERRRFKGKDISKMDGLLPPTRRAVHTGSVEPSKKKEKKWWLGNLLKKISSMKDYESSSNEDDIVFCKRQPKNRASVDRTDGITLRPIQRNTQKRTSSICCENKTDSHVLHKESRYSDGSLDGVEKKLRKSKVKARVEAIRDRLGAETSSDEDSRISSSSLTKFHNEDCAPLCQKSNAYHRRTRTARTERYMKRFSKDDGVPPNISTPVEVPKNSEQFSLCSNNWFSATGNTTPVRLDCTDPTYEELCSLKYTDFDFNNISKKITNSTVDNENHYGKIRRNNVCVNTVNSTTSPIKPTSDRFTEFKMNDGAVEPPRPPPRNPNGRIFNYNCHSFPINGKLRSHKNADTNDLLLKRRNFRAYNSNNELYEHIESNRTTTTRPVSLNLSPAKLAHVQETEIASNAFISPGWETISMQEKKEKAEYLSPYDEYSPRSSAAGSLDTYSTGGDVFNSNYISMSENHTPNVWQFSPYYDESEAAKCRRRNDRNNRLNLYNDSTNHVSGKRIISDTQNKLASANTASKPINRHSIYCGLNGTDSNTCPTSKNYSHIPSNMEKELKIKQGGNNRNMENVQDSRPTTNFDNELQNSTENAERRRSSKNLEEALSELEAIYNSLRLGDEELLDRAERRSMQEFCLKRGVINDDPIVPENSELPDRSKDDMAYRRMHPKERPSSLSDANGPLSNISYLMVSPILTRKENVEYFRFPSVHKDEPDVMLDDVVFRSINRANNTLKVVEPQPPFGIPIGPISASTESDYLHTVPKLDRSPYSPPPSEPDVIMDDLAFRTLRKDAGAGKGAAKCQQDALRSPAPSSRSGSALGMIKQQPPFGIPIGPVVAAPETDYLHATPTKPDQPRSPYLPQHEPDIVMDDLAYRTLRKDAAVAKPTVKCCNEMCKSPESNYVDVISPSGSPVMMSRSPLPRKNSDIKLQSSFATPTNTDYSQHWMIMRGNNSPNLDVCRSNTFTDDLLNEVNQKDTIVPETREKENNASKGLGTVHFATKKKRAVRSLSANLYGLINQDRIHLHRESNLQKMNKFMDNFNSARVIDCPEYHRRVVSDGEFSDQDYNWKTMSKNGKGIKDNFDINGNQFTFVCEKKLQVHMSPVNTQHNRSQENDSDISSSALPGKSLSKKTLEEEFWCDHPRSDSNISPTSKDSDKSIESDLTTYSQLCQNLADMIKWSDNAIDDTKEEIEMENNLLADKRSDTSGPSHKMSNTDQHIKDSYINQQSMTGLSGPGACEENNSVSQSNENENLESSVLHIESLGRLYSEVDTENVHGPDNEIDSTKIEDTLDYCIRLADENVKLIAEAFSDVADCLSKDHTCEIDSAEQDVIYKDLEDEKDFGLHANHTYDASIEKEEDNLKPCDSKGSTSVSNTDTATTKFDRWFAAEQNNDVNPIVDAQLSRVVYDLQIVAANLSDDIKNDQENEEVVSVVPPYPTENYEDDSSDVSEHRHEKEVDKTQMVENVHFSSIYEQNMENVQDAENFEDTNSSPANEKHEVHPPRISAGSIESLTCSKVTLDATEQTTNDDDAEAIVSSNTKKRSIKQDSVFSSEGENIVCELDAKLCVVDGNDSEETYVPYITNPMSLTAYSVILFACLVALLLANLNVT